MLQTQMRQYLLPPFLLLYLWSKQSQFPPSLLLGPNSAHVLWSCCLLGSSSDFLEVLPQLHCCTVAVQVTGGFMWQGFGSRGANISFRVCHQWGSQQCQEAGGSWHLWLSHVKSRNIELWSSNSPPHLDFLERRKKKPNHIRKKHRSTCIFWTCSLFYYFPALSLRRLRGLHQEFPSFPITDFSISLCG